MKFSDLGDNGPQFKLDELTGWTQAAPKRAAPQPKKPTYAELIKKSDDKRSALQRQKDSGKKNWFAEEQGVAEGRYPEVDHMPGKRGIGLDSAKPKDTYVATFHASKEKEAHEFAKKHGYIVKKHVYPKSANNSQPHEFQVHKNEQGVTEGFNGISVDIEPELDYDVVYVDINGKKYNFNYWHADEKPTNELEFRKDIPQYLQREEWYNKLDFPTKMEVLHAVVQAELGNEPSEYKPTVDDEPLEEGYAMDDIAVGGTVIYKSLDGHYKMSKVRGKGPGMSLQLMNGARIQNAAVVSTDQSDWSQYKNASKMTEEVGLDKAVARAVFKSFDKIGLRKGVAEAEKNPHPKTWHDVDPKLGQAVDKMSQAEKVKKGLAHPDTLKKKKQQGVAEGAEIVDQDSDLDQQVYTLMVDGDKVSFTYWDYEDNFQNPDIKEIYQQAREQLGKKLSPEQVKAVARAVFKSFDKIGLRKGVAEAEKNPHPKTWHDVDPKLGQAVDKMSQAEKVKKGLAHPDTLKKKGVAEGLFGIDSKTKGAIQNVVSQLSDIPGMWDHQGQTFTPQGLEQLQSLLKNNKQQIEYAVNLTADDFDESVEEKAKNPYAIGMAQAMKSTGDKPPLKKSTINKAHEIARSIKKGE